MKLPVTDFIAVCIMIDHFLGNTTRLNLPPPPPSTEFYIVIGRVRNTWLFFKLQLRKKWEVIFSH